ncbi:helix-turn-helix transcriptional regulator [uncultured Sphaerochaeta sp.]|uniref:helix-turn-helix domain-containing protein n=1 Tax=uncultured Sphaerochaeta sp. TaxID=886478 RepID=UPI002A0A3C1D|nr:helix-turn-helix transcriptional regulator [uncultured Sphaerochaeta sp.]
MDIPKIGLVIKTLRLQNKLTQQQFIEKADLTRSQIYYIETCKKIPRKQTLDKICVALGISYCDLINYQYSFDSSTPSISSIEAPGATIG